MIYLLYGQPASGKTVLGRMLAASLLTTYHIDGDEFRALFSNKDYGKQGRSFNIRSGDGSRPAKIQTYLVNIFDNIFWTFSTSIGEELSGTVANTYGNIPCIWRSFCNCNNASDGAFFLFNYRRRENLV